MKQYKIDDPSMISGEKAWIHARFMEGSDEICFTYRRKIETLRELVSHLEQLPSLEKRRYRSTFRRWQRIQELEAARLRLR
ncbi:MAG: hypothetical protein D4R76_09740 [Methylococcus sp.]|jgi:hypothetical protein|nr:MAG: hypothetical protein D4R76_09740 [Methylococcus sp.]